jgi:hypothetical protein
VEGLEAQRGWRVGLERPLNVPRDPRAVPAIRRRHVAKGTAATLLVGAVLAGCSSGSSPRSSRATSSSTATQTTKPSSSSLYDWQRAGGLSLDLGGGATSTLSSVVAPGATGKWLIAGTQFTSTGSSVATVWTSPNTTSWSKADLPGPNSAGSSAADAATDWGTRQVVVGSDRTGDSTRAAVWVSHGPGQPFLPVMDNPSFDPPAKRGAPSAGTAAAGTAVMDTVSAGALGVFAAGVVDGKATIWYSTDARNWQVLSGADDVVNQVPGAVVNDILATPDGVFAGGSYITGTGLSAALWYSTDGIHWTTVHDAVTSAFGLGDQVITSLVSMGPSASTVPGAPAQSGLLAIGGVRTGSTWQPASWISPNGSSWSQTSESFPLDDEPPESPGALAYAAAGTGKHVFAVGGSPAHQRLWQSTGGLAWSEIPLPAAAAGDANWHLGLVAADQGTTVLADNMPGQPYVLVRRGTTWNQPSANGTFGRPLPTAVPTSLVDEGGALVMSVQLSRPSQVLGNGTTSVAVLTSANGRSWRASNDDAFHDATVNQLLAVPGGLMAVGAAPLPAAGGSEGAGWTGAFASLSANDGATWPREPISPATLGGPGAAVTETASGGSGGTSGGQGLGASGGGDVGVASGPGAGGGATALAGGGAGSGAGAGTVGTQTSTPLTGPFTATAAGRLGNSEYVVGQAGPQAVGWYSPDGSAWQAPQPLDTSPQLATELPLATCWAGSSAVVVGSATSTAPGSMPAAWVSTDGSLWTSATFATSPPAGSTTTVDGCLSTGNGFIAYGGSTGSGTVEQPSLWSSSNGATWQQLPATFTVLRGRSPEGPEVAPLDAIALGTTTWLGLSGDDDLPSELWPAPVGGSAGALFTPAGLWASGNAGDSWQQLDTTVPAFNATIYAQADEAAYVGQDPVVAGTADGRLAIWVGTPAVASPGG